MYLQLLELYHFVHYFSHWLMLILRLNVLLIYIFKVASACGFLFFFSEGFVLKRYQGWGADGNVCSCLSLAHPVNERCLTRGCCELLSTRWFHPAESGQALDLNTVKLVHAPHVSIRGRFRIGPVSWVFFCHSYQYNCCQSDNGTSLSCQNKWEVCGHGSRKADEGFLNSAASCPVALRPLLQKWRQRLASGLLHNR